MDLAQNPPTSCTCVCLYLHHTKYQNSRSPRKVAPLAWSSRTQRCRGGSALRTEPGVSGGQGKGGTRDGSGQKLARVLCL